MRTEWSKAACSPSQVACCFGKGRWRSLVLAAGTSQGSVGVPEVLGFTLKQGGKDGQGS